MQSHSRSNFSAILPVEQTAKTLIHRSATLSLTSPERPASVQRASVAVVDDEERVCEALAFQLSTAGLQVMCFRSAQELLAADLTEFDCILADIFLPEINGLQLQEQLIAVRNFASIVFITGRGDLTIGVQAMRRGAVDVLEKPVGDRELLAAVTRAVERSRAERAQYARHAELEKRFRSLPARQRQVFTLITAGLLNKQVAAELGITERTVKVHRERLRRNMGANSLAELSRMAEILRITPPQTSSARTGVGSALERGL